MVFEIPTKTSVPMANDTTSDQDIPGLLFWGYTESYKPKNTRNSKSTTIQATYCGQGPCKLPYRSRGSPFRRDLHAI